MADSTMKRRSTKDGEHERKPVILGPDVDERRLGQNKHEHHEATHQGGEIAGPKAESITFKHGSTTFVEEEEAKVALAEEKAKRVRQVLTNKISNTREAVVDGLFGAQQAILTEMVFDQLPASAKTAIGLGFLTWLVDTASEAFEKVAEVPISMAFAVTDPAKQAVESYEAKRKVVSATKVCEDLIIAMRNASKKQLDAMGAIIEATDGMALALLDGKVDGSPILSAEAVAVHVRLLFEEMIRPNLPVREQVDRIHRLPEMAVDAAEHAEKFSAGPSRKK